MCRQVSKHPCMWLHMSAPLNLCLQLFACPWLWVILACADPSGHRSARLPNSLCLRGCLCAHVDKCFKVYLYVCIGEQVSARLGTCAHVYLYIWAVSTRWHPLAVSPHLPWTLTFFPFRPGLPSSPGFPCGNRSLVRRQG